LAQDLKQPRQDIAKYPAGENERLSVFQPSSDGMAPEIALRKEGTYVRTRAI
jgi:hypothetical protein